MSEDVPNLLVLLQSLVRLAVLPQAISTLMSSALVGGAAAGAAI